MLSRIGPGLLLCASFALIAAYMASLAPGLGGVSLTIVLGMAWGNLTKAHAGLEPGIAFAEKRLLSYSIILMGFGLEWGEIQSLGRYVFFIIFASILFTVLCSRAIGKALKMKDSLASLLGIGKAICGSAAVIAASMVSKSRSSPTRITSGSCLRARRIASAKLGTSFPTSRWLTVDFL